MTYRRHAGGRLIHSQVWGLMNKWSESTSLAGSLYTELTLFSAQAMVEPKLDAFRRSLIRSRCEHIDTPGPH